MGRNWVLTIVCAILLACGAGPAFAALPECFSLTQWLSDTSSCHIDNYTITAGNNPFDNENAPAGIFIASPLESTAITAFGSCKQVRLRNSQKVLVPLGSLDEWNSFQNRYFVNGTGLDPAIVSDCVTGCSEPAPSGPWTECQTGQESNELPTPVALKFREFTWQCKDEIKCEFYCPPPYHRYVAGPPLECKPYECYLGVSQPADSTMCADDNIQLTADLDWVVVTFGGCNGRKCQWECNEGFRKQGNTCRQNLCQFPAGFDQSHGVRCAVAPAPNTDPNDEFVRGNNDQDYVAVNACDIGKQPQHQKCEFLCNPGYHTNANNPSNGCIAYVCTNPPVVSNMTKCSDPVNGDATDETGLDRDVNWKIVSSCTENGTFTGKCEYRCNTGYSVNTTSTACVTCLTPGGFDTSNATKCVNTGTDATDESGLANSQNYRTATACNAGTKCEYRCNSGYQPNATFTACVPSQVCPNGTREGTEECDDNNWTNPTATNGDTCDSSCQLYRLAACNAPAGQTAGTYAITSFLQDCTSFSSGACQVWGGWPDDPVTSYGVPQAGQCTFLCKPGYIWDGTRCRQRPSQCLNFQINQWCAGVGLLPPTVITGSNEECGSVCTMRGATCAERNQTTGACDCWSSGLIPGPADYRGSLCTVCPAGQALNTYGPSVICNRYTWHKTGVEYCANSIYECPMSSVCNMMAYDMECYDNLNNVVVADAMCTAAVGADPRPTTGVYCNCVPMTPLNMMLCP